MTTKKLKQLPKFANEDAPEASALPGYGRAPTVMLLLVLGGIAAAGAGAAWYFGLF